MHAWRIILQEDLTISMSQLYCQRSDPESFLAINDTSFNRKQGFLAFKFATFMIHHICAVSELVRKSSDIMRQNFHNS